MQKTAEGGELNQYYSIGTVIPVGVIGGLGYYIYQAKRAQQPNNPPNQPSPCPPQSGAPAESQINKFEMD